MGSSSKPAASAKDRRKSGIAASNANGDGNNAGRSASPGKASLTVTLNVPSGRLRAIIDPDSLVKEDTPAKEAKDSPATSATFPAASTGENASDSGPATPAAGGTPGPQPMGPPTEGPKKKGVKRGAGAANPNGESKARAKPGPKKKQRLDDGTGEGGRNGLGPGHRLGPKANQGAINAGLRALDRSGKPCRRWSRGGFNLKSFTGVAWEVSRWTAPPKPTPESATGDSATASAEGSSKENKEDASQVKSDSNQDADVDADVDMQSAPSVVAANSPTPLPIAAAS